MTLTSSRGSAARCHVDLQMSACCCSRPQASDIAARSVQAHLSALPRPAPAASRRPPAGLIMQKAGGASAPPAGCLNLTNSSCD